MRRKWTFRNERTHSSSGVRAFVFSVDASFVACVVGLVFASGAHSHVGLIVTGRINLD